MSSIATAKPATVAPSWSTLAPALSPVVDRPDRRLRAWPRLVGFLGRGAGTSWAARARAQAVQEAGDALRALRADLRHWWDPKPGLRRVSIGAVPLNAESRVALYVHYSPRQEVSDMVLAQLAAYRALGFAIVFISMAPDLPESDRNRLHPLCSRIVLRRNRGLDFGAWHDLMPLLSRIVPAPRELLLVNDSLLGPLRPIAPLVAAMRAGEAGLCGLTESLAPRPHLQSYFLWTRDEAAVDLMVFLRAWRPTASKRRTVRRGEVRLTQWMRRRGHVAAACFGYEAVERTALRQPTGRVRMRLLYPSLCAGLPPEPEPLRRALWHRPTNPTHGFWRELVEQLGFPFIKTDLLLRNPIGIADTAAWRQLTDQPTAILIERHLAAMVTD